MSGLLQFIHNYNDIINLILGVAGIVTLIFSILGLGDATRLLSKIIISEKTNEFVLGNIEQWFRSCVYIYLEKQKDKGFEVRARSSSSIPYVATDNYTLALTILPKNEDFPTGKGNRLTPYTTIGIRIYKKEKWIHIIIDDKKSAKEDKFNHGLLKIRNEIDNESRLKILPWNQQSIGFKEEDYTGILLDYSEVPFFYQNEIMKITKKIIDEYFKIK